MSDDNVGIFRDTVCFCVLLIFIYCVLILLVLRLVGWSCCSGGSEHCVQGGQDNR